MSGCFCLFSCSVSGEGLDQQNEKYPKQLITEVVAY